MSVSKHYEFSVPASHPSLAGHFPDHPVVPGVVLLDHVIRRVEDLLEIEPMEQAGPCLQILSAKFMLPVLPDQVVQLALVPREGKINFQGTVLGVPVLAGSCRDMREQAG